MKVESSEQTLCHANTTHWTSRLLKLITKLISMKILQMKTKLTCDTVFPTETLYVEPHSWNPKPIWQCHTLPSSSAALKVSSVKESMMRILELPSQSTAVLTKMNFCPNSTKSNV